MLSDYSQLFLVIPLLHRQWFSFQLQCYKLDGNTTLYRHKDCQSYQL